MRSNQDLRDEIDSLRAERASLRVDLSRARMHNEELRGLLDARRLHEQMSELREEVYTLSKWLDESTRSTSSDIALAMDSIKHVIGRLTVLENRFRDAHS